jgi:hypothetical protein
MTDEVIARSTAETTIRAPLASIDLTEWIFRQSERSSPVSFSIE